MKACWVAPATSVSGATPPVIRKMALTSIRRGNCNGPARTMQGFFRDHYFSDLVGLRLQPHGRGAAAEDLHRRIRLIGERQPAGSTATVSMILDGENAWEYYAGNGREFLREFYRRVQKDPEIRALTMSEAIEAAPNAPETRRNFPGFLDQREF